jgi:AcrR family transcriptional regulator
MPRTQRKAVQSRYHHGALREALLGAGRALLEEGGPRALSLREIARRVGVSAPSAYHHFASLDAIAIALAEQGFTELVQALDAATPAATGLLTPAGEAYIAFARANPGLYRLMFGDGFLAASTASAAVGALRKRAYERVESNLQKRLAATHVPTAALFLWALTHGLALLIIDGQLNSSRDPQAMIRQVFQMAGTGIPRPA